jgi:hypothetical protein
VRVDGEVLFDEGAFPVVELAVELDEWLTYGLPRDGDLDYEVTGGEPGTLTIRRMPVGWLVDSVLREGGRPAPGPLPEAAVVADVRRFVDELAAETARAHGLDMRALLRDTAEARATDVGARRRRDLWGRHVDGSCRGMERVGARGRGVGRMTHTLNEVLELAASDDSSDRRLAPGWTQGAAEAPRCRRVGGLCRHAADPAARRRRRRRSEQLGDHAQASDATMRAGSMRTRRRP